MKQAIEKIEDLPLKAVDAWYTLLVFLGEKPGAWLIISSETWREGEAPRSIPKSTLDHIEKTLSEIGLLYHIGLRETSAGLYQPENGRKRLNQLCDIYIAKEQDVLDDIILARKDNDSQKLGLALGYPTTAVAAFNTDNKLMVSQIDTSFRFSETAQMTYFALSYDHWHDEITTVERWISVLKQHSPIIFYRFKLIRKDTINKIVELFGDKTI